MNDQGCHRGPPQPILANAMGYAVTERKLLASNPIRVLKWRPPKTTAEVDRRTVVNPRQARALLAAVKRQQPSGARLVAFFAVIHFAGLRPEEAISLVTDNVTLPALVWDKEKQGWREPADNWGELYVREPTPHAGREWTDDDSHRERHRQLKHRAEGQERRVPCPPEFDRHPSGASTEARGRRFAGSSLHRRSWGRPADDHLSARLETSPPGGLHRRSAVRVAARSPAVRLAARVCVDMAQRRCPAHAGGQVGRPQCGRATSHLCVVS